MDRNMPLPGMFYKYIDGSICQVVCVAKNRLDKGEEVIYQKMSPPFDIWAEPLKTFMGKAENSGMDRGGPEHGTLRPEMQACDIIKADGETKDRESIPVENVKSEEISDAAFREALLNGSLERKIAGKIPDSEIGERGFMELLDAESFHDKHTIFAALKKYLDKRLLNNIAAALDIVLEDGDEEEQYYSIMSCLNTFKHYETNRLR